MKTITLDVRDDIFHKVLDFLRLLPEDTFKVRIEEPDDIFAEEDKEAYNQSLRELRSGEAISLEKAKKELLGV
jgi:hypothetical protein